LSVDGQPIAWMEKAMNDYTRKIAENDVRQGHMRDVQKEHWKTQQDYNAAHDAAKKREAANKQ
jgi:hypothetical protein